MIKPVILHACETWTLIKILERNIERKVLRTIPGAIWDLNTDIWTRRYNKDLCTEISQSLSLYGKEVKVGMSWNNPSGSPINESPKTRPCGRLNRMPKISKDEEGWLWCPMI